MRGPSTRRTRRGVPVIHVRHVADIHPRILAAPTVPVVVKEFADGFEKTTLTKPGVTELPV